MWSRTSLIVFICLALIASSDRAEDQSIPIDPVLVEDSEGTWLLVRAHCTSCHSSQILKNLRLSRDAWQDVIKRMQAEEGLWDLGDDESRILEYLATNFGPRTDSVQRRGRRAPLAPD
ncbi:MAG: cytochrome C [Gammaproteobacteria bacterium]|nr:cytochrome C [Gammaproteobacteria bacterium]